MPFECENSRYRTDTSKGHPHGPGQPRGSVFREPISGEIGDYTLWLEHIIEPKRPGWEGFWLMWYGPTGRPTIKESAVFDKQDMKCLVLRLFDPTEIF